MIYKNEFLSYPLPPENPQPLHFASEMRWWSPSFAVIIEIVGNFFMVSHKTRIKRLRADNIMQLPTAWLMPCDLERDSD